MSEVSEVNVGPVDAFPVGELRIIRAGPRNVEVGVQRRADGRVYAVRNRCPHKGAEICKLQPTGTFAPGPPGTLQWEREGEILRCPWHGFEFEIETGKRPYSESRMQLRTYPARVEGDAILIDMSPQRSKEASSP